MPRNTLEIKVEIEMYYYYPHCTLHKAFLVNRYTKESIR